MKNKVLFAFFIIIALIGGIIFAAGITYSGAQLENVLASSLDGSGAEILESTISCWTKLNEEFLSAEQVTEIMDSIIQQLNPEAESIYRSNESDEFISKEILYAEKDNKSYAVAIESVNYEGKGETYIIVDVIIDKSYDELLNEKEKLKLMLEEKGEVLKFNTCVIGTFDGILTENEMKQKLDSALNSVGAKTVEGIESDEMSSISAFSDDIGTFIMSNNKKVNMQIAMRYSSYDDKTYIWIGSPLIHVEY